MDRGLTFFANKFVCMHVSSVSKFGDKGKAKIEVLSSATGGDIKPSNALRGH
jgi:hypothetical protein